jgi:hypothetical protein
VRSTDSQKEGGSHSEAKAQGEGEGGEGEVKVQPRAVRIPVDSKTVIHGSPDEILPQIKHILEANDISFDFSTPPYCLICKNANKTKQELTFELEICTIPNLDIYGLRFNRISGDMWEYQRICKKILKKLFMNYL